MKWLTMVFLVALLISGALLLLSSNDFDQASIQTSLGKPFRADIEHPSQQLAMTFAHQDHAQQQCAACHHNYLDDTGQGLCLDCHRSNPQIAFKMRDQFHTLCMGCHTDKRAEGEKSGPLRSCKACHTADQAP